jgi:hypothetical protein
MYLTSDELLKHLLSHHSITCWVCDYCASESGTDQSFIFASVEDWESHMNTQHLTAITQSQLPSLSKVSQRKILEPLACPLCGYVAKHATSTLDNHIAEHLHEFALRCLPWAEDGDGGERDSTNAKAADASNLSELSNDDEADSEYLHITEAEPTRLYTIMDNILLAIPSEAQLITSVDLVELKALFTRHLPYLESRAISRVQAGQMARQLSHPLPLADLFPASESDLSRNQARWDGRLLDYSSSESSSVGLPSLNPGNSLSEIAVFHLFKVTCVLKQYRLMQPPELYLQASDIKLMLQGEVAALVDVLREIGGDMLQQRQQLQHGIETSTESEHKSHGFAINLDEIKRYQLTEVYSHPESKADIVFVHGLKGDPRMTWQSENGTFWPSQLLPASLKSDQARILVYGYDAGVHALSTIDGHAKTMLKNLVLERRMEEVDEKPILFVAHSLGGILVKHALEISHDAPDRSSDNLKSIYLSTYGIMFLGTPHHGADPTKSFSILEDMVLSLTPKEITATDTLLVGVQQENIETLQDINVKFFDIYQRFQNCMVHENLKTDLGGTKMLIVDQLSASPMLPYVTYFGIEATHSGMSKFDSKNSPGYINVTSTLRTWVQEGGFVLGDR